VRAVWTNDAEPRRLVVGRIRVELGRQLGEFNIGRFEQHESIGRDFANVGNAICHSPDRVLKQISHRAAVAKPAVALTMQLGKSAHQLRSRTSASL
jgi:hypothetical protein